ncbi:hypothetical protein [Bartonella tribocorum]|uniref:Uncharacterized protein n=1 Tax=Bartonella tribocorum TaxID=85701 RepID=A0A2M6UR59_9HYPH|nr:hypothetical protein [Bartonella tribocorum]PIT68675.1 hypothetical protein CER18_06335 [Bartonella tribocorum]
MSAEATLMFDYVLKKTLSGNIIWEKFLNTCKFFVESYDIILIGKVDLEEIFAISCTIPFLKGKTLDTVFAGR